MLASKRKVTLVKKLYRQSGNKGNYKVSERTTDVQEKNSYGTALSR